MNENGRRSLILALKDHIRALIGQLHGTSKPAFDENNPAVTSFCSSLDMIFLSGIKTKEFDGQVPLWGLLERLETNLPAYPVIRNTVGAVSFALNLHTPLAKARGWIRQCLNTNAIEDSIEVMLANEKLLSSFYSTASILRHAEEVNTLLAVLRAVKIVPFSVTVDDRTLYDPPAWLTSEIALQMVQVPKATLPSCYARREIISAQNESSASTMDRFLSKFERTFDTLVNKMETTATSVSRSLNNGGNSGVMDNEEITRMISGVGLMVEGFFRGVASQLQEAANALTPDTPMLPLFGTHLEELVLDDVRCAHAKIEPRIGAPDQILNTLKTLQIFLETPGIFRRKPSPGTMQALRDNMEEEKGIAIGTEVYALAACLLQWLYELPEPLLSFDLFDAVMACQEIEDEQSKIRNLSCLFQEAPWYSKTLLLKLLPFFQSATEEKYASKNGLTLSIVSIIVSPFIVRSSKFPIVAGHGKDVEETGNYLLATSAVSSNITAFIIKNHAGILAPIRQELLAIQSQLNTKVARIRALVDRIPISFKIDLSCVTARTGFDEALDLWCALELTESTRLGKEDIEDGFVSSPPVPADSAALLSHVRWEICGFPRICGELASRAVTLEDHFKTLDVDGVPRNRSLDIENGLLNIDEASDIHPLHGFDRNNGMNALLLLTSFLKNKKTKAAIILCEFSESRRRFCSLVHLSVHLAGLVNETLRLTQISSNPKAPISSLSKTPVWHLLNDENCVQEVFDVSLLTFDDMWRYFTEKMKQKPTREIYEVCMLVTNSLVKDLLDAGPENVEDMWLMWSEQRIRRQRNLDDRKVQRNLDAALTRADSHSTSSFSGNDKEYISKRFCGITTRILGGSVILSQRQIAQLEAAFPTAQQCYDWRLLYRLSDSGSVFNLLLEKAKRAVFSLLVIRSKEGVVFGALISEKLAENSVYYGRGPASVAVWTFRRGIIEFFPASMKDAQYIRVTPVSLAFGGDGVVEGLNASDCGPAIYLYGNMQGKSMYCSTFLSPVLNASTESFTCSECEFYSLEHVLKGK